MSDTTRIVIIRGEECDYDPETHIARVYCSDCSAINEVEVFVDGDDVAFQGFVCEKCGAWNGPED